MRYEGDIIKLKVHPIVETLVQARMGWQMTIADIANRCGVAERTLYYYEAGEREPCLDTLDRWARVFGYDIQLVFHRPSVVVAR